MADGNTFVLYLYIRVTLKPMKKLNFLLLEVVPSEVVTPTKYINTVKFHNFILMFTGGSTLTKFLMYHNVLCQFQFT